MEVVSICSNKVREQYIRLGCLRRYEADSAGMNAEFLDCILQRLVKSRGTSDEQLSAAM
jgi:hypothetical protein